uniref:EF-hand domain-containing protein n=1 Tax=Palpitomonas bilix TaxID=652834 RepID=A0A7S3DFL6_9EUKA|mmetsp:Transcript_35366/g.91985  ORF Transcript_35366/g.91985 Transcript_35366/m.91985 type:complete len:1058 (+) Transcript_35366:176-3349(+)
MAGHEEVKGVELNDFNEDIGQKGRRRTSINVVVVDGAGRRKTVAVDEDSKEASTYTRANWYRRSTMAALEQEARTSQPLFSPLMWAYQSPLQEDDLFDASVAACHAQQGLSGRKVVDIDCERQVKCHLFYYSRWKYVMLVVVVMAHLLLGFFEWHWWCETEEDVCNVTRTGAKCNCSATPYFTPNKSITTAVCFFGEWECGVPVLPDSFPYKIKQEAGYSIFENEDGEEPNRETVLKPMVSMVLELIILTIYLADLGVKVAVLKRSKGSIASAFKLAFRDIIVCLKLATIVLIVLDYLITESVIAHQGLISPNIWFLHPTRCLRPIFLISTIPQLRRIFRTMLKALKEILSVLALIGLFLLFFCILGTALFLSVDNQRWEYFPTFNMALINLIVLLSTANYPDVMMPAYRANTAYFIFFFFFIMIGLYFLFSLVLAVVYNFYDNYQKKDIMSILVKKGVGLGRAWQLVSSGQGKLELPQWMTMMKYLKPLETQSKCRILFSALDKNAKGYLDEEDFEQLEVAFEKYSIQPTVGPEHGEALTKMEKLRKCRHRMRKVVLHKGFRMSIDFIILINMLISIVFIDFFARVLLTYKDVATTKDALTMVDSSDLLVVLAGNTYNTWNIIGFFFLVVYIVEAAVKLIALTCRGYFRIGWNGFDFFLVSVSVILEVVDWVSGNGSFSTTKCGVNATDCYYYDNASNSILYRPRENGVSDDDIFGDVAVSFRHIILLFRTARGLRLLSHINTFKVVVATLLQLLPSLAGFFSVIFCGYYFFAIIGVESLGGRLYVGEPNQLECLHSINISDPATVSLFGVHISLSIPVSASINTTMIDAIAASANQSAFPPCGFSVYPAIGAPKLVPASSYHESDYYKNNFNGVIYSIITLFELMVVNNWFITMDGYVRATASDFTRIYFVAFYVISVIFIINVVVAFVIDAFIMKFEEKRAEDLERAQRRREGKLELDSDGIDKDNSATLRSSQKRGFDALLESKLASEEKEEVLNAVKSRKEEFASQKRDVKSRKEKLASQRLVKSGDEATPGDEVKSPIYRGKGLPSRDGSI